MMTIMMITLMMLVMKIKKVESWLISDQRQQQCGLQGDNGFRHSMGHNDPYGDGSEDVGDGHNDPYDGDGDVDDDGDGDGDV